jgi:phasin family protein
MLQRNNVALHKREGIEMTSAKESFELFNEMSSKGYEAARQLGEINLRTMEQLVGRQMDAVALIMESGLQQVKMVSEAKGYNELVKGQVDLAKGLGERVLEESRNNMKLASDTRDEYRAWLETGMDAMREKMGEARHTD